MNQRPFGHTGLSVAPLGIGSIPEHHGIDTITTQMHALLDVGANLVDTAQCYGNSEAIIGEHLSHRRDEMVLVSKCGHHAVLADGSLRSRAISMADVDGALQRLRTDYLDAMLLHSYDLDLLIQGDALGVLEQARDAGKIRHIGYSGDNERLAWAVSCPLISVVECSLSLADQHNVDASLAVALRRGVGVIAKRPIAVAAWLNRDDPDRGPENRREYARRLAAMDLDPADLDCATWGELALRFTLGLPGAPCAIVSCSSERNRLANINAAERGPLGSAEHQRVRDAFLAAERVHGGQGIWLGCN